MLGTDQLMHIASLERYAGATGTGDKFGDPVTIACYYEGVSEVVRDSSGNEAVSSGRLFTNETDVPAGSRVTVLGRRTHVLRVSTYADGHGLDHLEVALA